MERYDLGLTFLSGATVISLLLAGVLHIPLSCCGTIGVLSIDLHLWQ